MLAHGPAPAADAGEAPRLALPVDCEIGRLCVVQSYVDADPGPGARDHRCGPLATDGHDGIDIRLPSAVEMRRGVAVVAAAAGLVMAATDGAPDRPIDGSAVTGRGSGNTVVIDHGAGWVTQYSHLRRGSLVARTGARVAAGQPLGQIGLSGRSEFPHLHFSLRHHGRPVDPFTGQGVGAGCAVAGGSLWTAEAGTALAYRAGGLLAAGFAARPPSRRDVQDGGARAEALSAEAPLIVFWGLAWGLRAGDREHISLSAADGALLAEERAKVPGDRAEWLRFLGARRPAAAWPPGRYRARYRVERPRGDAREIVIDVVREIVVR